MNSHTVTRAMTLNQFSFLIWSRIRIFQIISGVASFFSWSTAAFESCHDVSVTILVEIKLPNFFSSHGVRFDFFLISACGPWD